MHTIEFPEKNLTIELPSEWEDCTEEQVHFIIKNAFDVMQGDLSIAEFRIKVFTHLTGLKFGINYLIRQKLNLNNKINERIFLLSEQLCDWVFIKNDEDNFELNFQTIKNCFPILNKDYYGPADLLSDITLSEFKSALSLLDQYFEAKEDDEQADLMLNYFIGSIYRPKNEKGIRLSFHGYVVEPERFSKVPVWQKQVTAIWFSYCVKCLQEEELTIDGIDVNLSSLFPQSSPGATNSN
ncbi:MAG: hypothetical protein ACRDE7_11620, partial [Sphingobacterium sp.]